VFAASVGFNSLGFAFWFDFEANKDLAKPRPGAGGAAGE